VTANTDPRNLPPAEFGGTDADGQAQPTSKRRRATDRGNSPLAKLVFGNPGFDRGRSLLTEAVWLATSALLVGSWIPGSAWRRILLRAFGARIGAGVVIKPSVKVKFPWRLTIGDRSSIGERAWIDNLAQVTVGNNCCISQDVYFCTGNHDWSRRDLPLNTSEIVIGDDVWIGARAVVGPGARVAQGAVVTLGSVVLGEVPSLAIVRPSPSQPRGVRRINP
jgi:putative colanic acid biosynthesis acetyltransferase WcaF